MADDLGVIRRILESTYHRCLRTTVGVNDALDALAALARLEGRVLPALPEGYILYRVQQSGSHPALWVCEIEHYTKHNTLRRGRGPTPRAAVLAALAQVGA